MKQKKPYVIYSKVVARKLCEQGFRIIKTEINNEKPWLNVFLFENTDELQKALALIVEEGRRNV